MIILQEQLLITKFVIKQKQDRYLGFLANVRTRRKFTRELYHFKDFDWKLFEEIPGSKSESEAIYDKINHNDGVAACFVISAESKYDKKEISIEEAVNDYLGIEGTILIFGDAQIVYY